MIIEYREYEDGIVILDKEFIPEKLAEKLIGKLEKHSKISLSDSDKKYVKEKFIKNLMNI